LGRRGTPATSLWVQCALSCVAVWFLETFSALATTFIFTMWIFYALAGSAIFVLRVRRPDAPRPARCPGYPVVPGLFVLASLAMTVMTIAQDPEGTLPWLGVLVAGVPVYYLWEWARRRGGGDAGGHAGGG
jgi:APA family basic amino acid/polyamine antiporter